MDVVILLISLTMLFGALETVATDKTINIKDKLIVWIGTMLTVFVIILVVEFDIFKLML